jgi:hypothetical protein
MAGGGCQRPPARPLTRPAPARLQHLHGAAGGQHAARRRGGRGHLARLPAGQRQRRHLGQRVGPGHAVRAGRAGPPAGRQRHRPLARGVHRRQLRPDRRGGQCGAKRAGWRGCAGLLAGPGAAGGPAGEAEPALVAGQVPAAVLDSQCGGRPRASAGLALDRPAAPPRRPWRPWCCHSPASSPAAAASLAPSACPAAPRTPPPSPPPGPAAWQWTAPPAAEVGGPCAHRGPAALLHCA